MTHPNEPALVFRALSGVILPTRAFSDIVLGPALTPEQGEAFAAQIARQKEALRVAPLSFPRH